MMMDELAMAVFNGTALQLIHPAYTFPIYLTNCNGTYVNLDTDNNNCGNCGDTCPTGQVCENGTCVSCN